MNYRDAHPWFKATFVDYTVPEEMKEAFWNYLAYGFDPGGFGTAIFSNDFLRAVSSAHRMLTSDHLRSIALWVQNYAPADSFGSLDKMYIWQSKTDEARRDIMIKYRLRPSVIDVLKGVPA